MHTNSLYTNFPRDRSLLWITLIVLAGHLMFIFMNASMAQMKPPLKPLAKRVVVQTITLNPPPKAAPVEKMAAPKPPTPPPPIEEPISLEKEIVVAEPPPIESLVVQELEPLAAIVEKKPAIEEQKPEIVEEKPVPPKPIEKPKPTSPKPSAPAKKKPDPKKPEPVAKETKPKPKPVPKAETKKPAPKVEKKKEPAKPVEKKEPPKEVKPKVDPQAEALKAKRKELLDKAQKSIAQIDQNRDKLAASLPVSTSMTTLPGNIERLHIETFAEETGQVLSPQEASYYDELASRLRLQMRMPEYGGVRIKLTLERSGKFITVSIVSAESKKNREYIEKTLPTLKYPGFGNNFKGEDQYTFCIALSNDL